LIRFGLHVLWLGLILNSSISQWAIRWRVPIQALQELEGIFGLGQFPAFASIEDKPHSESYVQSLVRLEAGRKGVKLWRNNVGVLNDETGRPVRYGLGNDSPALNKAIKSGDLIGWRSITITPDLVGTKLAQFVSRECKKPNWNYSGTDREQAQLRWAEVINADGGNACFVTGEGSL
jgi:hypothetical protein